MIGVIGDKMLKNGESSPVGGGNGALPPSPITPQQRQRMEQNRRLALLKQQERRRRLQWPEQQPSSPGSTPPVSMVEADECKGFPSRGHNFGGHCELCKGTMSPPSPVSTSQITLTRQQVEVLKAVAGGQSVFITGSAGTGKSFLLHHAISVLKGIYPRESVFVTASTGVAACAIKGQTLHSFAGIGLGEGELDTLYLKVSHNKHATKNWERAKALVVDEISMIDGQMFDNLEFIARRIRNSTEVWGGIQLVISGDFFQLPPVKPLDLNREYAFEATCWEACFALQVELTRVFRQSDSALIELLQSIREGRRDPNHMRLLDSRRRHPIVSAGPEMVPQLYPKNEDVRRENNERLRSLSQRIVVYSALDSGEQSWRDRLGQGIAPNVLEVCVGARVMLIKNINPVGGLVNGSVGIVMGFVGGDISTSICSEGLLPVVKFDHGPEMTLGLEAWDTVEGDMVRATRKQIPLILAWAVSIHKCQGMTLSHLQTDLSKAFGCGMVYVALSRVRSLDGLYLSGLNPQKVLAHPKVLRFYKKLVHDHEQS
ncbi:hypothetical protein QJS04_geneDACA012277 [Acorus gramineus]|uniref:ATP-dependent DNA helicase n=1 Tax=Acorus gramineus TaxID=55184 RepID=A0AAV9B9L5_ACOGR|nr:hypothetical protein QJS04_geneDACA012277 [Acorus gramineus]